MKGIPYIMRYDARVRLNSRERLNSRDMEQGLLGSIPEDEVAEPEEPEGLALLPVVVEQCHGHCHCVTSGRAAPWYQDYLHEALFLLAVIIVASLWAGVTLGWLLLLQKTTVVGKG